MFRNAPISAVLLASFFWGASFIAIKFSLMGFPPITVVALRCTFAAILFAWLTRKRARTIYQQFREEPLALIFLSLSGIVIHFGSECLGLQFTTAGKGSLISSAFIPLAVIFLGIIFLKEKLPPRRAWGCLFGLAGVVTVMGWETLLQFKINEELVGDLLVILSGLAWAVYTIQGKGLTSRIQALDLITIVTVISVPILWAVSIFEWESADTAIEIFGSADSRAWLSVLYLGFACSFAANLLYFIALEKASAQRVGLYLYTTPITTYALAYLMLGEGIGSTLLIGTLLVAVSIYLTETSSVSQN